MYTKPPNPLYTSTAMRNKEVALRCGGLISVSLEKALLNALDFVTLDSDVQLG